jgi:hypothetical protein
LAARFSFETGGKLFDGGADAAGRDESDFSLPLRVAGAA